ncbi:MAG: DMT family transporter [Alphaproteobacteria bacterium]|nr:DMT family transporter [Alphaproteobacteria bacterium]
MMLVPRWRGFLLSPYSFLLYSVLIGSANNVIGRAVIGDIPPVTLSFVRIVIAVIALLPLGLPALLRQRQLFLDHWKFMVVMAIIGIANFNTVVYVGLQTTTAINASLISASMPVLCLAIAWFVFREGASWLTGIGILVSLSGVVVTISQGDPAVLLALSFRLADLFILGAVLGWSFFSVFLRRLPAATDPFAFMLATMVIGGLALLPFFLLELAVDRPAAWSVDAVAAVLYLGIFASVGAYYCWNRGVASVGATTASQFAYLSPIYSASLAVIFLGEELRLYHAVSFALIFAGIFLTTRRRSVPLPTSGVATL